MKKFVTALTLLGTINVAFASQEYGCVQYQKADYSWGDPYKVPVTIVTGSQLNEATNSYKYQSYSNYALAEWPNGGYSALEMPSYYDDLPYSYTNTKDQNGRKYRIKEAPSYGACSSY